MANQLDYTSSVVEIARRKKRIYRLFLSGPLAAGAVSLLNYSIGPLPGLILFGAIVITLPLTVAFAALLFRYRSDWE
jgi:hypothetical protein